MSILREKNRADSTRDVGSLLEALARRVEVAESRPSRNITNAMTGEPLGQVPHCTRDDVVEAARRARAVQPQWAARPIRERAEVLLRFHDLVLQRQEEVLDIIQLENGKARRHAFEEVGDVCLTARYYANTAADYLSPKRRQGVLLLLTEVWEHHQPKGLVGVISPWNYPLTLGISDALPAIVAGNAVLAKPDDRTPFSALWAVRLLEEAGMPTGLVQIVTGPGSELGTPIIEQADFLMFTGSTSVGRKVATQAAERLIDYSMELGGKNALLVLDDADVGKAATGALRASFSNTGQLCISIERIYVPTTLWDPFVERFVAATKAMKLSPALDYSADMGSLISEAQIKAVAHHVDDAVGKGATVLAGGRPGPTSARTSMSRRFCRECTREWPPSRTKPSGPWSPSTPLTVRRRRSRRPTTAPSASTSVSGRPTRNGVGGSPPVCRRAPSTSTRPMPPRGGRSTPRWEV